MAKSRGRISNYLHSSINYNTNILITLTFARMTLCVRSDTFILFNSRFTLSFGQSRAVDRSVKRLELAATALFPRLEFALPLTLGQSLLAILLVVGSQAQQLCRDLVKLSRA